jgi:hypothetical protein
MKQVKTKPNVFVVDTPYQLLNAIEAIHSLQLSNNHLFLIRFRNSSLERFLPLIKAADWARVSFPSVLIEPTPWVSKALGARAYRWYCCYLNFKRMRTLAKIARSIKHADKIFLGHYWAEEKWYMRHIANTIKYNALYLLDDGTDTIDINERRNRIDGDKQPAHTEKNDGHTSLSKRLVRSLRTKYWTGNVTEAPSVTFFTTYEIDVRNGDLLVRNNYDFLRSMLPAQQIPKQDAVLFIGQCIVDDRSIEANVYLDFLSKVREYFAGKKLIYVPHPRESASWVAEIGKHLQCDLWSPSSVIEYDLIAQGVRPNIVAGFQSSALISLARLMDPDVKIVSFYIDPVYWKRWRENVIGIYNYLKTKAQPRVTIVPLSI